MEVTNNNNVATAPQQGTTAQKNDNAISIKDLVFIVINSWYWFAISVFICLVVAAFVYKSKPKTYSAKATILVRDDDSRSRRSSRSMDQMLNNMGLDNSSLSWKMRCTLSVPRRWHSMWWRRWV